MTTIEVYIDEKKIGELECEHYEPTGPRLKPRLLPESHFLNRWCVHLGGYPDDAMVVGCPHFPQELLETYKDLLTSPTSGMLCYKKREGME